MIIFFCCPAPCWMEGEGVLEMRVPWCRGTATVGNHTATTSWGGMGGLAPEHHTGWTGLGLPHCRAAPTHCSQGLACIPHPCHHR